MQISNSFALQAKFATLNTNNADITQIRNYIIEHVESDPYLHILLDKLSDATTKFRLENVMMTALFTAGFDSFATHEILNMIIDKINMEVK